jgi:DNA polymerase III subunit epsilon
MAHTLKLSRPLIVLDLETTGTWVEKDRIVEVALVRCLPDGRSETFTSRVNPGMPIPPRVSRITGITDEDVKEAPSFKQIAPKVLRFIGDADLGGFNIERFDLIILERELFGAGLKFEWRTRVIYDAQKVYHLNERRDLKAAYQFYCGKELINSHTAQADAEATVEILSAQTGRYGKPEGQIEQLQDFEYQRMDDFFDSERKFRWWNCQLYPVFGKYGKRKSLKEIAQVERSYLEWMLKQDFAQETKQMLRGALEGRFPQPPEERKTSVPPAG